MQQVVPAKRSFKAPGLCNCSLSQPSLETELVVERKRGKFSLSQSKGINFFVIITQQNINRRGEAVSGVLIRKTRTKLDIEQEKNQHNSRGKGQTNRQIHRQTHIFNNK